MQYLIKPVTYADFQNAMEIALKDMAQRAEAIKVFTSNEIVAIAPDSFLYSEAQRNYQCIYVADGECEKTRMSCTKLYEMLKTHYAFVMLGASYIVNLDYVAKISSSVILLKDDKKIPVPRGSFPLLKQRYVDFYMKGGNESCSKPQTL